MFLYSEMRTRYDLKLNRKLQENLLWTFLRDISGFVHFIRARAGKLNKQFISLSQSANITSFTNSISWFLSDFTANKDD